MRFSATTFPVASVAAATTVMSFPVTGRVRASSRSLTTFTRCCATQHARVSATGPSIAAPSFIAASEISALHISASSSPASLSASQTTVVSADMPESRCLAGSHNDVSDDPTLAPPALAMKLSLPPSFNSKASPGVATWRAVLQSVVASKGSQNPLTIVFARSPCLRLPAPSTDLSMLAMEQTAIRLFSQFSRPCGTPSSPTASCTAASKSATATTS
mmetsp:Transcript_31979/g.79089  ORF Transcript_31979/g.79089 Transcript_31979/m.79089 type:complete len:217 (-) Transcript_31979:158-808(-)